jgi:hypothetical protein
MSSKNNRKVRINGSWLSYYFFTVAVILSGLFKSVIASVNAGRISRFHERYLRLSQVFLHSPLSQILDDLQL